MKILVVGCGSIGRRHIANLLAIGGHGVSAVDTAPAAVERVRTEFSIEAGTDLSAALETKPDCVFITTPPSDHIATALKAARHGCHLFIEKPLSHTLDGIEELSAQTRERNLVSMVGCNMRFHPNIQFLKDFIGEGRLGKLYSVQAEAGWFLPKWRPGTDYRANYAASRRQGGGVLLDAIHEMDYVRWIGGEFEAVECVAAKVSSLEIETEDLAEIVLKFKNGALGRIHLDYLQHPYSRGSKWVGEKGILLWEMQSAQVRFFDNAQESWKPIHQTPPDYSLNDMYTNEVRSFLDAVAGRKPAMSSIDDAAAVLKWTLACQKKAGLVS